MTVQNPPIFLQAGSHPAEDVRRALGSLLGAAGTGEGLVEDGGMAVTQSDTPAMSVSVASGRAWITGTESTYQGSYFVDNRGSATLTIDASDATNPRVDLIVARIKDSDYSGSDNEWELEVITGTAAASPTTPATPDNSLPLCTVDVAALASTIVNADITDLRTFLPVPYAPGGNDVAIADGGTGSSTASSARTSLGLEIGSDVQAYDSVLDATTAAFTNSLETKLDNIENNADVTDAVNVKAAGAYMIDDGPNVAIEDGGTGSGNASGARNNLGLKIGTDVQDVDITDSGGLIRASTVDDAFQEAFRGEYDAYHEGSPGAATTLPVQPAHKVTMSEDCTISFTDPIAQGHTFLLLLAGDHTPTWPAEVEWSGGVEPTHVAPALYGFTTVNTGSQWIGVQIATDIS